MSSSDEQRHDRFNVDADFEGGVEIGGEFFYERRRAARPQTRDEALYGHDSSNDDARGGRRGRKRGRGDDDGGPDYSRPVGFVRAGVVGGDAPGDGDVGAGGDDRPRAGLGAAGDRAGLGTGGRGGLGLGAGDSGGAAFDDDDGDGAGARAGLGGGGRGGLGAGLGSTADLGLGAGGSGRRVQGGTAMLGSDGDDGGGEWDEEVLPGEFGRRIKERAQKRADAAKQAATERRTASRGGRAGAPASRGADGFAGARRAPEIGAFEQHTKGIGAKLLSKMGFKPGEGLGRNKQGIAVPIQAEMRPKGVGMGFGDRDEPHMVPPGAGRADTAAGTGAGARPGGDESARDIAAATRKAEQALWKKRDAPRRAKREYRTADEVLAAGGGGPTAGVGPILDMRGPTARVVADASQLGAGAGPDGAGAPPDDDIPMPELQHNLRLLVDLAAADIARLDARARSEHDTVAALRREADRSAAAAGRAGEVAARLEGLDRQLTAARTAAASATASGVPQPDASLAAAEAAFRGMKAAFIEEYALYGVASAAAAAALPLVDAALREWAPLADPARGAALALRWRPLLEVGQAGGATLGGGSDPYERLVRAALAPRLAQALTNGWDARDPDPGVALVEAWDGALPPGPRRALLEGVVLPKLGAAVTAWDPASDPVPVHAWLHPWLPLAGPDALADLWPAVRHKLAAALANWHPSDGSALPLLRPWHRVFSPKDWDALLRRCVLPKLAWALGEALDINPAAQDLAPWHWTMAWSPLLPATSLAALLDAHFWPRWHATLRAWLASPGADPDEVTAWFQGWQALLPPVVADVDRVRAQLAAGLDAVNAALGGGDSAAAAAAAAASSSAAAAAAAAATAPSPPPPVAPPAGGEEPSLRTLVEAYAADAGVALLPRPGRRHDGHQVYAFGRVPVLLDGARGVVRMQMGGAWMTASLEDVAAEHARREAGGK